VFLQNWRRRFRKRIEYGDEDKGAHSKREPDEGELGGSGGFDPLNKTIGIQDSEAN
jgi:hypothetical protein